MTNIEGGKVKEENLEGKIKILGSEYSQLKTYSELTKSITAKKKGYKECLEKLSDNNFSEDAINKCIGEDFEFFDFDIDYERMKVKSRIISKVDYLMIEKCYKIAKEEAI